MLALEYPKIEDLSQNIKKLAFYSFIIKKN